MKKPKSLDRRGFQPTPILSQPCGTVSASTNGIAGAIDAAKAKKVTAREIRKDIASEKAKVEILWDHFLNTGSPSNSLEDDEMYTKLETCIKIFDWILTPNTERETMVSPAEYCMEFVSEFMGDSATEKLNNRPTGYVRDDVKILRRYG